MEDQQDAEDAGDAFAAFFNAYAPRMQAFGLRRTGSPAKADDLLAATMEVAWHRFADIPKDAAFGWLCGVALRVARNQDRGRGRYQRMIDAAVAETEVRPLVTYLENTQVLTEQREAIVAAFQALDELDREVLRLVAWEGLSGAQLAAALDVSEATARKRLSRARERLRNAYSEAHVPTEVRKGDPT